MGQVYNRNILFPNQLASQLVQPAFSTQVKFSCRELERIQNPWSGGPLLPSEAVPLVELPFSQRESPRGNGSRAASSCERLYGCNKPKCARLVFAFFHFGALLIKLVKMLRTHFFFPLKHARVYAA